MPLAPCPGTVSGRRRGGPDRPAAYRGGVGVLGELFPGPKISDEAGEDAAGQPWRLGPIDLDRGTVEVHRTPRPDDDPARPTPPGE